MNAANQRNTAARKNIRTQDEAIVSVLKNKDIWVLFLKKCIKRRKIRKKKLAIAVTLLPLCLLASQIAHVMPSPRHLLPKNGSDSLYAPC